MSKSHFPKKSQPQTSMQQNQKIPQVISSHFQGPVPPPDILAGYDNIHEGLADRIIALAEKETAHRHTMEEMTLNDVKSPD
jgi:uncharacterized membrane protein